MAQDEGARELDERSLTDQIQHEIESMLLSGLLGGGSRVNEKQLAEKLGVSRAPVREATRALQQLGLVEIIRNRGVFVRQVNLKDVVAIFDIRIALARLAASEAARRMTPVSTRTLSDLIDRMDAARAAEEYLPLNIEFHRQVFLLSDNARLAQLDTSLGKELRLYRLQGLRSSGSMRISNEEHRAIFAALADRNPELAGRLFEQHVLAGRDRFLATVDRQEPPPPKKRGRPRKTDT
jgi:DNA-binding GntR family transcriptional regulator